MVTQDTLKALLQEGEVTVTFTKKDQTVRVMRCTQKVDLIPAEKHPKGNTEGVVKHSNPDTMRVYDLEAEGWRSFNYSTVTDVDFTPAGVDSLTLAILTLLGVAGLMGILIAVV